MTMDINYEELRGSLDNLGVTRSLDLKTNDEIIGLWEQIQFHKYIVNQDIRHEITLSEAVFSWIENVYNPIIEVIEDEGLWDEFKHLSKFQLFSNIGRHWYHLKVEGQNDVSPRHAALDFCSRFASKSLSRFVYKIKKAVA